MMIIVCRHNRRRDMGKRADNNIEEKRKKYCVFVLPHLESLTVIFLLLLLVNSSFSCNVMIFNELWDPNLGPK